MEDNSPPDLKKLSDLFLEPIEAPRPAVAQPARQLDLPTFTPPDVGMTITSRVTGSTYQIGSPIGEGHFGIVYAGTDTWTNDLAIKVFKPRNMPYEMVRDDAVAEYQKLTLLRHPFITYIFDAFEYRHTFYIVTERCYRPLNEVIRADGFNGQIWLKAISRCVLQALHFIHSNNFAHQDLHLGNVFAGWTKDELVPDKEGAFTFKIGDLGLTKLLPDMDARNTVLAEWMKAPEALDPGEFGPMDHRMDIYHVGLLFLQVLLGKEMQFTREEILSGKPRDLAMLLPAPHGNALEKTLRRHAMHRPMTAMEVWQDLQAARPAA